jgi:hypothetical protein
MLQSTAEHISICLDKPVDQIQIAELGKLTPRFKVYLVARRFKRNSVRSYINYLRVLLRKAEQLGWKQQLPDVAPRWREIRRSVLRRGGAAGIVKYAIREAIPPQEFGETALDEWGKEMLARGRTSTYVTAVKNFFRKRIFDQGFSNLLPDLSAPSPGPYGVSLDELPEPLRSQVIELFRWKVAKFSEGRPTKSRHRPVTARNLQGFI